MTQSTEMDISGDACPQNRRAWLEALEQTENDEQLQDLIFSYLRLTDARLKALAVSVVQGLARPPEELPAD